MAEKVKINFGCGSNILTGWQNYDVEIDISHPLPFPDNYADFILAEHCIEHISPKQALGFFQESFRILKAGGVLRVCIPGVDKIYNNATKEYFNFLERHGWGSPDIKGAISAIVCCHGHQSIWTTELLNIVLSVCGFNVKAELKPTESDYEDLRDIDGHWKIIGREFNAIETIVTEAVAVK